MRMEKAEFVEKLRKVARLTGYPVEVEVANALYDELRREERQDVLWALKCVAYGGDRLNLANILKHLHPYKAKRLEKEAAQRKEKEAKEIEEMPEGEVKKLLSGLFKRL